MSAKAEQPHLRPDAQQKALLQADSAADVLADRCDFMLDQQAWRVFDETLTRPAGDVAGLRELLAAPTILDATQTSEGELKGP